MRQVADQSVGCRVRQAGSASGPVGPRANLGLLGVTVLLPLLFALGCAGVPRTGEGEAAVDRAVHGFMKRWNVPGLALAVVDDGRLVLARGYGYADPESGEPAQPDSFFRIASASKPVTAIAVMTLVEAGRLDLDDAVFRSVLPAYTRRCPDGVDPRLHDVTVRHLLIHASGWDTGDGADPMFNAALIARQQPVKGLTPAEAVIQDRVCRPLDFAPGTRQVYENLNYAVLGRVIEAVASRSYERFVRQRVFLPLGIDAPRIGHGPRSKRLPGEVAYLARGRDRRRVPAVSGDPSRMVPLQYGGFLLSAMDSHGGWVASAIDLARLMAGMDRHPGIRDILDGATIELMGDAPDLPHEGLPADLWYAMGWYRTSEGAWFHDGSLPGSASFMRMEPDGTVYAALVNTRHPDPAFATDFRAAIRLGVDHLDGPRQRDLFPGYGYPPAPAP